MEFRKVIQKNLPAGHSLPDVPAAKPTISIDNISFTSTTCVFDILPAPVKSVQPKTFEDLLQPYGYLLYRTTISNAVSGLLKIKDLRDYGIVFINGKRAGILDRRLKQDSLWLDLPKGKVTLDILVENMGRINFGPYLLKNKKGITEKVLLADKELLNWQMFALPFSNINTFKYKSSAVAANQPVVKKGTFQINTTGDTYLDMSNWGKGVVWVNGHNLGRYWNIGPQQSLYLPAEWLKKGNNEIVVLELIKSEQSTLRANEKPVLDVLN
jgi:beta-galactosidase